MNPLAYATMKHEGQVRKYTGQPYIVHPIAVASLVATVEHTQDMLTAAILHDTVEDTDATLGEIESLYGPNVAYLVWELTKITTPEDGNRAARSKLERTKLRFVCQEAMTIKLADLIDNTTSIVKYDPEFAKVYLEEKRLLLEVMTGGSPILRKKALEIIK